MPLAGPQTARERAIQSLRAYRRRGFAITAVFVAVTLLIVVVGAAGFQAINILRSYATAESHWSRAEKTAVVELDQYAVTRSEVDYREFEHAVAVLNSFQDAREALSGGRLDFAASSIGFRGGGNDEQDLRGLEIGYVLFRNWAPFAASVADWRHAEGLLEDLKKLGDETHAQVKRGVRIDGTAVRRRAERLDDKLTTNELNYAGHMNEASRRATFLTLIFFAAIATVACASGIALVLRAFRSGRDAELHALASEERTRDFAAIASDWYCEFDPKFRIRFVSQTPGDESANMQGQSWQDVLRLNHLVGNSDQRFVLDRNKPFRGQQVDQTLGDGQMIHWSTSGKPVFDGAGKLTAYRVVATDITPMIRIQEDLKQARTLAEQASRAKSAFLANMSHELRTPLNAIIGFSEIIEQQIMGPLNNPRYCEYAGDIRTSGQHLLALINDLLDHSRIEAGELVLHSGPFDIRDAIDGVRLFCQHRADALNVTLSVDCPPALPAMLGDALRFKQVLINLVTNAVKFSSGGSVTVTAYLTKGSLHLEVLDTGIGMDAAGITQAMRPFGQVESGFDRKYEGTGLGLPLAKSLVEAQGGTLAIASKPGAGTKVTIIIPFVAAIAKAA